MDDHFGVGGRLEDRAALDQLGAQRAGVGNIAVMRHREAAAGQIGIKRLDVAQARSAGGRIADMPGGHDAGQFGDRFLAGKIVRDMADAAAGEEFGAVEAGDPGRFLPAVLKRVEAQRGGGGGIGRIDRAEHAALFAQLVAVLIEKRMGEVHQRACPPRLIRMRAPMAMLRSDYKGSAVVRGLSCSQGNDFIAWQGQAA